MGIVDIALHEYDLGVKESGVNEVKYNNWYYGRKVSGKDYPWCAVFVSWCANQAGCLSAIGGKTSSVNTLYDYFRGCNRFHAKKGYKPKVGDIMIQMSSGASHTGIVYAVDGSQFYTVEGNSSNKVNKCSYPFDHYKLTGFGSPNYSGDPSDGNYVGVDGGSESGGSGGSGGSSESLGISKPKYTNHVVKKGETIQSIAKKYKTTVAMIVFLNGLKSTSLKTGQKLLVPKNSNGSSYSSAQSGTQPIQKKYTKSITVSHPTIEVEFYTEYGTLAATANASGIASDLTFDNDIVSLSTSRNMSDDCPTFTMNLVWRNKWFDNLASNDLLVIRMQRPPETKRTVFLGLIDDIRRDIDFSSGTPQRVCQVTGRGLNKAFVNFQVGMIENLSTDVGTGFMSKLLDIASQDSAGVFKIIIESYVGKAIQYSFGNGKNFKDYFQKKLSNHKGEILVDSTNYTSYVGSLWNLLKELGNAPFDETYWEVENEKATLIHRPTPFNKKKWNKLKRHTITADKIVVDNIGRSDLETYTLYSVSGSMFDENTSNYYFPLWYKPFYAKYGINQLQVTTAYQMWENGDGMTTDSVKSFFVDLYNWNIKNNVFHNGTLTVKGEAKYKVGERVILEDENLEFYVEGVTQHFNLYQSWTTELSVTRGIEPEERFTPPWNCYEEFTPSVMQAIINQTSGQKINWKKLPTVSVSSTNNGGSGYTSQSSAKKGDTISIPSGMGTCHSYMGWQCITSKSSAQYKLRAKAGQKFDSQGFGIINGRYVVATTTLFGSVGDYIDVTKSNGTVLHCIIGDIKNQSDSGCNKYGHKNGKCVIEFVVDKNSWYSTSKGGHAASMHANPGTSSCHPEWKSKITKVTNQGHYDF